MEKEKEKMMKETYGLKQLGLFDVSTQDGSLAKTFPELLAGTMEKSSKKLSLILKKKVTKYGLSLFQLQSLVENTNGREFGLLPTIRASEYKGCGPKGSKSHTHWIDHFYLSAIVTDSGKLNPMFAERMMGFPEGWTDLKR